MVVPSNINVESTSTKDVYCTICIANYNGEDFIGECISSIIEQEFHLPLEIIIHDDSSSDNSIAYIESNFPQIKLLKSNSNIGFCISNNRMVKAAAGSNILLLNNDARLHKNALSTLFHMQREFGEGIYGLPQYDMETGELIDRGSYLDPFFNPIPNKDQERKDVGMVIGACLFTSKKLWMEIGGFPAWFGSLAEDMYLCSIARLIGYPVKVADTSGFDHWVGKSLGGGKVTSEKKLSTNIERRAKSERNKTYVMFITTPYEFYLPLTCLHLFSLISEGFLLSIIKWDRKLFQKIYFNTILSLHEKRTEIKYLRRKVHQKRVISIREYISVFIPIPHKLRMLIKYGIPRIS